MSITSKLTAKNQTTIPKAVVEYPAGMCHLHSGEKPQSHFRLRELWQASRQTLQSLVASAKNLTSDGLSVDCRVRGEGRWPVSADHHGTVRN